MSLAAGTAATVTGGNVRAVFMNVNAPETRGTVFGILCIMDDVGKGFGPFLAAFMINLFGRQSAFTMCTWMWALCAIFLVSIAATLERDEQRLQNRLAKLVEA
jgi:MFS-type transporter involved in bile tolerance (Atg22 family)